MSDKDIESVLNLIADIVVNEFNIQLKLDGFDSDLKNLYQHYNKVNGGCFWVAKKVDNSNSNCNSNNQIVGTAAVRNLRQPASTCELKRMFVLRKYRGLGIGQMMLDVVFDYAKKSGYSNIYLYSSKDLQTARKLYLKNGFVSIPRYNDDYRADVFMARKL
ncbi:MAG TPA: GNAT family N-acetyltransferase [Phototrophicaceae bacterium]|nr:GNAT family N-acetyltransferase [Phototrophicaceae bacterium]